MNSLWLSKCNMPRFPSLKKDINADVLIIGGGMAGILTAYLLHKSGVKYVLVEKGLICSGTTQNTTAKITFQHGLIYNKILKSSGLDCAQMYLYANKAAFERYVGLCKSIDCDYEVKDNFVYSLSNRKKLEDELKALEKIGYNAKFCKDIPLPFKTAGAIKFTQQAQFHPLKFASSIAKGLNIYENTFVREMVGKTAVTDHAKIHAQNVIVATHFPFINKHGSYFLKLYQHRSYLIALENAQNVGGMYVDEEKTGMTFRNYKGLLLVGGGGHRTGKSGGNWKELRSFAQKYYPNSAERFYWAAQDCMSLDSIPYIGKYSKSATKLYTATGFNKWGITGSMLAAMLLCDAVIGKSNDFAPAFEPSRSVLRPQLLINGFESVANLIMPAKRRCPHLGCALKWNNAEHSWDCPCHGSRFSEKGRVLDNPANGDLKL